ncbi:MAG: hypothetical protein ABF289_13850, partial [Clostridiales bacterium]
WNERYSTSTLLNTPRLLFIVPIYLISNISGINESIFLKLLILSIIFLAAISMYAFGKRLVSVYFSRKFDFFKVFALITGALFYALNPWIIERIQHIYLLCGYSLFPLVLMYFFNIFDPKFQKQLIYNYNIKLRKLYTRNVFDIFVFAIVFSLSSAAIHYFFFGIMYLSVILALIVIKNVFVLRKVYKDIQDFVYIVILKCIVISSGFMIFSGYWFLSYLGSFLFKAQASQHNVNVIDTLSMYSRYSSIKNVLLLISYWWPMFDIQNLSWTFYMGGGLLVLIIIGSALFISYKHNIILFLTLSTILFMIFATGVKLDFIAEYFIFVVTQVPIIGSIFRDPNKLVGLMAVGYSILLIIGIEHFFRILKWNILHNTIKVFIVLGVIVSLGFYIKPFYDNFINGFYHPVSAPKDYLKLQKKLYKPEKLNSKVLYLPIADNMLQSHTGVATPFWNTNNNDSAIDKATGDMHIYTSSKNTFFHHEGNVMSIAYYYNFLQYLIDNGFTENLGKLVSAFGVNEMVYHNEYKGNEYKQDFNEDIISMQKDFGEKTSTGLFSSYKIKGNKEYIKILNSKVYTTGGYSKLESFSNIDGFDFEKFGVIFSTLNKGSGIRDIGENDYIECNDFNELYLSNLQDEYYIEPFNYINNGNAFLNWSKTLAKNSDWLWFLSSQGIGNYSFDFDFSSGIALTLASSKINVPSYKMDKIKGELVADFNSMLKMEKFFKADNPGVFEVIANPKSQNNNVPLLHGEIIKGNPKNIWQVAKSGIIDAKGNTPYKFSISASGRGTNKLHVKMKFFDEKMTEIGNSYVVAPSEETNFDEVNMYGEYVSPKGAKYMRIDLLSYQRTEQKNYWWIHNIEIKDLSKYKARNEFIVEKSFDTKKKCKLYIRTFINEKGGELSIKKGNDVNIVSTKSNTTNEFKWVYLGEKEFSSGTNEIAIESISGFNAVNIFACIPIEDEDMLKFPIRRAIEKSNIFNVIECENDFNYLGNIQSDRAFTGFSMGRGIASQNGLLKKEIEIIKSSKYSIVLNIDGKNNIQGHIKIKFISHKNGKVIEKVIKTEDLKNKYNLPNEVIDLDNNKTTYPKYISKVKNTYNGINEVNLDNIYLNKGKYLVEIEFSSNVKSESSFEDVRLFDSNEIKTEYIKEDEQDDPGYTECIKITPDMTRMKMSEGILNLEFDKTCSISWYNYTSKIIDVIENDEYLITFEARSSYVRKRHTKVIFMDSNKKVIDTTYINEVEEKDKNKWNKYQQIVKVPSNARYMQFHILCKGFKEKDGFIKIKDYSIIPYKDLITVDNMIIWENKNNSNSVFDNINKTSAKITKINRVDTMKRSFKLYNPNNERVLINIIESPNPLWEFKIDSIKKRGTIPVNGVMMGVIFDNEGSGEMKVVLREIYYFGLVLICIGFLSIVVYYKKFV